jgi:hypothetical protein
MKDHLNDNSRHPPVLSGVIVRPVEELEGFTRIPLHPSPYQSSAPASKTQFPQRKAKSATLAPATGRYFAFSLKIPDLN